MPSRIAFVSGLLLACLTACAALGLGGDAAARRLLSDARAAIDRRDDASAYRDLAEIRRRHPESPVCAEAFPLAAAMFQRRYFRERLDPGSTWMKTEPTFMLDWFASFFEGPEYPAMEARALFAGMPYGFFREYLAYAATRPALARFEASAEEDNGIVESVAARLH